MERWPVELFFRQSKGKLVLDKYQIRDYSGATPDWRLRTVIFNTVFAGNPHILADHVTGAPAMLHKDRQILLV